MKRTRIILALGLLAFSALELQAQQIVTTKPPDTVHYVEITYNAPSDANASTTYKFFVSQKPCPADGSVPSTTLQVPLGVGVSPVSQLIAWDLEGVGGHCYFVTANTNGIDSGPSNTSTAIITPFPPVIKSTKDH